MGDDDGNSLTRSRLGWVALMVVGEVVMAVSAASLDSVRAWAQFTIGALLVAVGGLQLRTPVLRRLRQWLRVRPSGWWLRATAWAAVLIVAPVAVWFGAPPAIAYTRIVVNGCPHPVELRVLTSPDDLELYRSMAERYEQHTAEDNHGCRTTNVSVYDIDPARGIEGLAAAWSADYLRDYGQRPDLLVVNSAEQVATLRERVAAADYDQPGIGAEQVLGWTPLVLGVPVGLADLLAGTDRRGSTWHETLRAAQKAGVGVVRPHPAGSITGTLATHALYSAADGGPVDAGRAREVERWTGSAADAGRYPLATSTALLRAHRDRAEQADQAGRADPLAALVVPEQALVRSNQAARADGRGTLPGCAAREAPPDCLIAFYPVDTFRLEHTVVPLLWGGESPARLAARGFTDWLRQPLGQEALTRAGLRTTIAGAGDLINERHGALPGPRTDLQRDYPDPERREEVARLADSAQRDGRVLVALDTSGSMKAAVGGGRTRLTAAVGHVGQALDLLDREDTFALATFSGGGVRLAVPFGPKEKAARQAMDHLAAVSPAGGTPLYQAIAEGVGTVGPSDERRISALVVLTDGEDSGSAVTEDQLIDTVRERGVRVFVVALGDADCAAPVLAAVARESSGACLDADAGEQALTDLFRQLWG